MKDDRYHGKTWFVRDVCGIMCAIFSYILMIFAQYVLITILFIPEENSVAKVINIAVFEFFTFLAFAAHLRTMFTDPGAVPKGTATKEAIEQLGLIDGQVLYKCTKCCSIKPERAHHCSVCQRCIRKMDHHCPWVNNCVGENNQKFFVLFTFYIAIISIHALILVCNHFMKCLDNDWRPTAPINIILLICVAFEGLLFAIFTLIMFVVQMQAIWNDETSIEQLKKETDKRWSRRQRWRSLRAVFGLKGFSIEWFSPFTKVEPLCYAIESPNYNV
ncbi:palmitoyltransferase ZDHHC3-like protein 1 [Sarcoptes scabiei]|uniref:Palmitoyltransferase n=1 Tax=Sarcoptes scabiei TaxID=52283 RepID=A0A132ACB4_SARSC|nr:palmitoyltransferase ZDHHC3-like protein 1 [Sarcoptes scabiei]